MSAPTTALTLPTVLVLAAGRGERFIASGGATHKLSAMLGGKTVLDHVLDAVHSSGLPLYVVQAHASRPGMGDSIAAGVRATAGAAGWLVLPGDLPLVRSRTLLEVARALQSHAVVVPVCDGQRGHPVGFNAACGPELQRLQGSKGAAAVMTKHQPLELHVTDIGTITDIDTVDDLHRAAERLAGRGNSDFSQLQ